MMSRVALVAVGVASFVMLQGCGSSGSSDTSGTSSAIVLGAKTATGATYLTVKMSPKGSSRPQTLKLDTGSSTLAFCSDADGGTRQDYVSCAQYGTGLSGFWGYFYEGSVNVFQSTPRVVLGSSGKTNVYYAKMSEQMAMCDGGQEGIFGIAFRNLNTYCTPPSAPSLSNCCEPSGTKGNFESPIFSYINNNNLVGTIGIYWSGQSGPDQGKLYIGQEATNNKHFDNATSMVANLITSGFYEVRVSSANISFNAILDTGDDRFVLPWQVVMQAQGPEGLTLELDTIDAGVGKKTRLTFSKGFVESLSSNFKLQSPGDGGLNVIGLPLWRLYYTVFDINNAKVIFVPSAVAYSTQVVAIL